MDRKISLGAAIAYMFIVAALTFAISFLIAMGRFSMSIEKFSERQRLYKKLEEIERTVRLNYYGDTDTEVLLDSIADGYIDGLGDRYGMYLSADEYARLMQDYSGKTADIGVSVVRDPSGYIKIIEVYPDSSAYTAGIERGDLIVKIEETDINYDNAELMMASLRGEAGTTVNIVVRRDNEDTDMEITRRPVEVPMVVGAVYGDVGYLRIKEFNNNTPAHFTKELAKLMDAGVQALIFDVRNNPGGTITSVCAVLDELLPEGDLVSATHKDGSTEILATSGADEVELPMVILTNGGSASASELFAQAIKDYNKGRTVGTTTYGKGMMQTIFPLEDGSAVDITTAKFNPPGSPNFDGVGVKPDYEVKLTADQEKVFYDLDEQSDPQLRKALELANAVIKTGGFEQLTLPEPDPQVYEDHFEN